MVDILCAICGKEIPSNPVSVADRRTVEHVIPTAWYPDSTPGDLERWTVPSHQHCNNSIAGDEQYVLERLATTIDPSNPAAAGVWGRVLRGLSYEAGRDSRDRRARGKAHERLMAETVPSESATADQIQNALRALTNPAPAQMLINYDHERADRVFTKILKCIFYKLNHYPLSDRADIKWRFVPHTEFAEVYRDRGGNKLEWFDCGPGCKIGYAKIEERGGRGHVIHILLWEAVFVEAIIYFQIPGWAIFADPWGPL